MKFNTVRKLLFLFSISFMQVACNNQQPSDADVNQKTNSETTPETTSEPTENLKQTKTKLSKLILKDLSGKTIASISNTNILDRFYADWKDKTKVVFIKKPDLPYQLELLINDKKQVWLYDGHAVVTNSAKGAFNYYQLKSAAMLNKLLKKQLLK